MLSLVVCVVAVVNAQEGTSPEEAFEAMAAKWGEAWNKGELEGLAALYAEDADLISNDGKLVKGRDAIVQSFVELAGTAYKGTQISIERTHIRQITPNIMVGDSAWGHKGRAFDVGYLRALLDAVSRAPLDSL